MKTRLFFVCLAAMVAMTALPSSVLAQKPPASRIAMRYEPPPPGWSGPVFELVHNYPTSNPGTCDRKFASAGEYQSQFQPAIDRASAHMGPRVERVHPRDSRLCKARARPAAQNQAGWKADVDDEARCSTSPGWPTIPRAAGVRPRNDQRTHATLGDFIHEPNAGANTLGTRRVDGDLHTGRSLEPTP